MKENFSKALDFVLQWEGGFVNHPKDPGGATNKGITRATFSKYVGRPVSISELKSIAPETVRAIYRRDYWNAIGADALPPGVDLLAFDIAVNSGPGRALRWLDETSQLQPKPRVIALDKRRVGFYRALRTFPVFGKGWLRREAAAFAAANKLLAA
jgi:lysozyme family protein